MVKARIRPLPLDNKGCLTGLPDLSASYFYVESSLRNFSMLGMFALNVGLKGKSC